MLRVRARIDEELDRHDHPEQRQRRQPRRQAGDQEQRAADLERRGHAGRDLGRQHRHLVLVGEELHRQLPARDLVQAGLQEDARDRETKHTLNDRDRKAAEELGQRGETASPARGAQHGRCVGVHRGPPWSIDGALAPTMSPRSRSSLSAWVRSKLGSAERAASTALWRSRPVASARSKA